ELILGPAIFDRDVLSVYIIQLFQPLAKRKNAMFETVGGYGGDETDHRQSALLRPRSERPRCRAAEERGELASAHAGHSGFLPPWRRWLVYRMLSLRQIGWAGPWRGPELF